MNRMICDCCEDGYCWYTGRECPPVPDEKVMISGSGKETAKCELGVVRVVDRAAEK